MTPEVLVEMRRLMVYDPETGVFTRTITSSSRAQAGTHEADWKNLETEYIRQRITS